MATYTPKDELAFRTQKGSLSKKIATELAAISTAITTAEATASTASEMTVTLGSSGASLAAAGFDIADATGGETYGVFVAPYALTITGGSVVLTEAYVKDTSDAKIEIMDNAATPVVKADLTLADAGVAAKTAVPLVVKSAAVAAGTILNVKITATAADTGAGHALIALRFKKA